MNGLIRHTVKWLAPSPLWPTAGPGGGPAAATINRPEILRFASDSFTDELLALMGSHPERLGEWTAVPETWRSPAPIPAATSLLEIAAPATRFPIVAEPAVEQAVAVAEEGEADEEQELKIYQPAHQRYYLVAASLVCRQRGLPDRRVDPGRQESVGFVMRRLIDDDEYAFIVTPGGGAWQKVEPEALDRLQTEEERLAMSAVAFNDHRDHPRRLWVGMVPVAKREAYMTAPPLPGANGGGVDGNGAVPEAPPDPRKVLFQMDVTEPWKALLEQAEATYGSLNDTTIDVVQSNFDADQAASDRDATEVRKASREQIQTISWYVLLDFAKFLQQHVTAVWDVVLGEAAEESLDEVSELPLYEALRDTAGYSLAAATDDGETVQPATVAGSLAEALKSIAGFETGLEEVTTAYDRDGSEEPSRWPDFLFPLADPGDPLALGAPVPGVAVDVSDLDQLEITLARLDGLAQLVEEALGELPQGTPEESLLTERNFLETGDGLFAVRCLYERPDCGPFAAPVVSERSRLFRMASFFDADAPARPIRIQMPMDISPAGLRKHRRNAGFIISDALCGQIGRIRKTTFGDLVLSVLPWPFHKGLPDPSGTGPCARGTECFGMVLSLSIPIVTLCALILMIIMVTLFDMFFKWLPLLFTMFPIPGLKGKQS